MKRYSLTVVMEENSTDKDVAAALRNAAIHAAEQVEFEICPLPEVDSEILFEADNDMCVSAFLFRSE